jgi:hypothetical protein
MSQCFYNAQGEYSCSKLSTTNSQPIIETFYSDGCKKIHGNDILTRKNGSQICKKRCKNENLKYGGSWSYYQDDKFKHHSECTCCSKL